MSKRLFLHGFRDFKKEFYPQFTKIKNSKRQITKLSVGVPLCYVLYKLFVDFDYYQYKWLKIQHTGDK